MPAFITNKTTNYCIWQAYRPKDQSTPRSRFEIVPGLLDLRILFHRCLKERIERDALHRYGPTGQQN